MTQGIATCTIRYKTIFSYKMWRWWRDELTRFLSLESFGINVIDFGWNYGKPTSHRGLGFNQFPFWSHNDAAISGRAGIKSHKRGDYWKVAAHSVWSKPRKYYLIKSRKILFDKYLLIKQKNDNNEDQEWFYCWLTARLWNLKNIWIKLWPFLPNKKRPNEW